MGTTASQSEPFHVIPLTAPAFDELRQKLFDAGYSWVWDPRWPDELVLDTFIFIRTPAVGD